MTAQQQVSQNNPTFWQFCRHIVTAPIRLGRGFFILLMFGLVLFGSSYLFSDFYKDPSGISDLYRYGRWLFGELIYFLFLVLLIAATVLVHKGKEITAKAILLSIRENLTTVVVLGLSFLIILLCINIGFGAAVGAIIGQWTFFFRVHILEASIMFSMIIILTARLSHSQNDRHILDIRAHNKWGCFLVLFFIYNVCDFALRNVTPMVMMEFRYFLSQNLGQDIFSSYERGSVLVFVPAPYVQTPNFLYVILDYAVDLMVQIIFLSMVASGTYLLVKDDALSKG